MKYELAKELEDAGYPQTDPLTPTFMTNGSTFWLKFPTLSELIEACGRGYRLYCMNAGFAIAVEGSQPSTFYPTPEEAVARLWLDLNKKVA
jgi:hypothetical protein